MRANYDLILGWAGLSEGGYVNHPKDPGGATDRGITQRTFDAWRDMHKQPRKPVRGISKQLADEILAREYLDAVRAADLPSGLDYSMADYAINSGPSQAIRDLQRALGVRVDGHLGPQTLAAIQRADTAKLIVDLNYRRFAFMKSLKHWNTFKTGWTIRVMGNVTGVQSNDIGVIDRSIRLARAKEHIPQPTEPITGRAEGKPTLLSTILSAIVALFEKV